MLTEKWKQYRDWVRGLGWIEGTLLFFAFSLAAGLLSFVENLIPPWLLYALLMFYIAVFGWPIIQKFGDFGGGKLADVWYGSPPEENPSEVLRGLPTLPPKELLDEVMKIRSELLSSPQFFGQVLSSEEHQKQLDAKGLGEAAVDKSLRAYLSHFPYNEGPFTQPLACAVNISQLSYDLIQPFRDVKAHNLLQFVPDKFHQNVVNTTYKQTKGKGGSLIYPQDFRGECSDIPKEYFSGLPFLPLLEKQVPLPLPDELRFTHHHVLGQRGKGKTTFLSHMIDNDFKRTPEVSVVVIDSQFRLIDGFAHLPGYDPIFISPSNPIPLNPFRWGNVEDVVDILSYAFGSVFEADLTSLQSGPVSYIIRAVAQDPEANLDTLVSFLQRPNEKLISKTDSNTQTYFEQFFKSTPKTTMSGIAQRVLTFRRNTAIDAMLNASANELDLPKELQDGRIILIDTNKDELTSPHTQVFGRLFIALLHNTMRKRVKVDENKLKPAFIYIDELADYCPAAHDDSKFREVLDQARKQRMGLIVAHQRPDQVNPAVLKALEDSSIHTRCIEKGDARITVNGLEKKIRVEEYKFAGRVERTKREFPPVERKLTPMSYEEP